MTKYSIRSINMHSALKKKKNISSHKITREKQHSAPQVDSFSSEVKLHDFVNIYWALFLIFNSYM